jgi:phage repressor protein C with HTH and peptisase S24 domain
VLDVPIKKFFEFDTHVPTDFHYLTITSTETDQPQPPQTVPYYSLDIAAGLLDRQSDALQPEGWVKVNKKGSLKDYFAAVVRGRSMEPTIPSGALCLFKIYSGGSRNGQILLIQARGLTDPEFGGRYVIKRYRRETPVRDTASREHISVKLISDNPEFAPIELKRKSEEEISTPAIFVEVLEKG